VYPDNSILNPFDLETIYSFTMSLYTKAEIRCMIDDLDDKIRAAVITGAMETVFVNERLHLVSKDPLFVR